MTRIYAIDVDETLEISGGPVRIDALRALKADGHVLGICGNWHVGCMYIPDWADLFSFVGPAHDSPSPHPKTEFLQQLRTYLPVAEDYVMVGNDPAIFGESTDKPQADLAGWRFIREFDFEYGAR